jgi:hypothetical protein
MQIKENSLWKKKEKRRKKLNFNHGSLRLHYRRNTFRDDHYLIRTSIVYFMFEFDKPLKM